jgi:hypothetical protein
MAHETAALLADEQRRRDLGCQGANAVRAGFTSARVGPAAQAVIERGLAT